MVQSALQSLWREQAVADAPGPLRRDWLLVGLFAALTVIEAVFRENADPVPAAPIACLLALSALPWRRVQPLAAVAIGFGSIVGLDLVNLLLGREPFEFYTFGFVLILSYSVFRWGSGRDATIGASLMVVAMVFSLATAWTNIGEAIAGAIVLYAPAGIGAAVRFRNTARAQAIDQVKLDERQQLAREMHDTVAHHVSAIAIRAQAGRAVGAADHGAALDALAVIEEEASRTLTEMRTMVGALRAGDEPDLGPVRGVGDIERLARPGDTGSPRVDVELGGGLDGLRPSLEAAIYRLAQESITNGLRHARHATRIAVRVEGDADNVRLTVRDDGDIATAGAASTGYDGFGLLGMSERAKLLGGTLEAGPGVDGGWSVQAVLPRAGSASGS